MAFLNKVNAVKGLEYDSIIKQEIHNQGPDSIVGVFSTFTHSWLACGSKLFVINNSDGSIQCSWTFGENSTDLVEVTCAIEFQFEGCSIPLLIVGISSENTNKICFFNPNTRKIVRAIECNFPVRVLCIIEDGLNEVNPLNDALTHAEGLLAVGCADGSLYVIDLCRGMVQKALNGDFRYISDEEEPVDVYSINVASVSSSLVQQKLEECYNSRNSLAVCLIDQCDDGVTALCYSYESAILYVGTGSGSFLLWNMTSLNCLFHSQSTSRAVISLSLLEPCDDPRHNLFLWICYENYSQAVMYCISFASKFFVQGYGVYYQGFESAGLVYRLVLGLDENLTGIRPINSVAVAKSVTKNITKSFSIPDSECTQLRLFVTSYETISDGVLGSRAVVFDLNQWYKEQMPDEGLSSCIESMDLGIEGLWHLAVDHSSLSHYQWVRPLEQHFHPSALDFKLWSIEDNGIQCLEKLGLQSQWLKNMKIIGPSVLLNPQQVFHGAISAGLLPTFIDPPDPEYAAIEEERTYVLTVCLENRATSVIEHCAQEWATGSHPVAGCTLGFLIDWLWELHGVYKSHGNRMCVPLFDQSGLRFDVSERKSLQHCKSLLVTVQNLYLNIIRKYSTFVLTDGLDQKLAAMSLVRFYFDCCLKLISVNLLPEPNEAGRPAESIAYKFDKINDFVCKKRKLSPFLGDTLIGQSGGEREWEAEGGTGKYPPPSIQAVLRYCLHPSPTVYNKLSLMLYLYIDIVNTYTPLRNQESIDKVKNFQYLLRIPDVQFKIVASFWYLDHDLFFEGTSLLMDQKILPVDLTDDQHRSILKLLSLQGQEKLALQYLRLKSSDLHHCDDFRLELDLLLSNRLINEAFMFQRKHPEYREELLTSFFQGCIEKKLLGQVFGLHLDPKEESVLLKFLKTSDLQNKGDLQVLLLLSRAKYTEAVSLNDRLNSTLCGPKTRLETDTRDMIVRGITGGLNSLSREMALENRRYKPPPPGTRPMPLSALIKIRSEPDGPLLQTDCRGLLSAATKSARHLSDFVRVDERKTRKRAYDEDENMDIDVEHPPRKRHAIWGTGNGIIRELNSVVSSAWPLTPHKTVSQQERQVMELVGTPLVKKRGKRISPHSKPSSILKGKTPDGRTFLDDLADTPSRKMLRFALPESENPAGSSQAVFKADTELPESMSFMSERVSGRKSLRDLEISDEEKEADTSSVIESIKGRLRSSKNKLLEDGRVDWKNLAEVSKPKTLFTLGTGKTLNARSKNASVVKPGGPLAGTPVQSVRDATLDITITSSERKYLQSPSREAEDSPITEAVFNMTVPKRLFDTDQDLEDVEEDIDIVNKKYLSKESFIERYKKMRNKNISNKPRSELSQIEEHKDVSENVSEKSFSNQNKPQSKAEISVSKQPLSSQNLSKYKDGKEMTKPLSAQPHDVQKESLEIKNNDVINEEEINCAQETEQQYSEESKTEEKEIGDLSNLEKNEVQDANDEFETQELGAGPLLHITMVGTIDQETFYGVPVTEENQDEAGSFSSKSLASEKMSEEISEKPDSDVICLSSDEDKESENEYSIHSSEEQYSIGSPAYDDIEEDLEYNVLGISQTKNTVALDSEDSDQSDSIEVTRCQRPNESNKSDKNKLKDEEHANSEEEEKNVISETGAECSEEILLETGIITNTAQKSTIKVVPNSPSNKLSSSRCIDEKKAKAPGLIIDVESSAAKTKNSDNISNEDSRDLSEKIDKSYSSNSNDESSEDNAGEEVVDNEDKNETKTDNSQEIEGEGISDGSEDVILIDSDEDDDDNAESNNSAEESEDNEDIYASEDSPVELPSDSSENDDLVDFTSIVSDTFLPNIVPIKIAPKYETKCEKTSLTAESLKPLGKEKPLDSNTSRSTCDLGSSLIAENRSLEPPELNENVDFSSPQIEIVYSCSGPESSFVNEDTPSISLDNILNNEPVNKSLVEKENFVEDTKQSHLLQKDWEDTTVEQSTMSDLSSCDKKEASCSMEFSQTPKLNDDSELHVAKVPNLEKACLPEVIKDSCKIKPELEATLKNTETIKYDKMQTVNLASTPSSGATKGENITDLEQVNPKVCGPSLLEGNEHLIQTSVKKQSLGKSEDALDNLDMKVADVNNDVLKKKSRLENFVAELTDRIGSGPSPTVFNKETKEELCVEAEQSDSNCSNENKSFRENKEVLSISGLKMITMEPNIHETEEINTSEIDTSVHSNNTLSGTFSKNNSKEDLQILPNTLPSKEIDIAVGVVTTESPPQNEPSNDDQKEAHPISKDVTTMEVSELNSSSSVHPKKSTDDSSSTCDGNSTSLQMEVVSSTSELELIKNIPLESSITEKINVNDLKKSQLPAEKSSLGIPIASVEGIAINSDKTQISTPDIIPIDEHNIAQEQIHTISPEKENTQALHKHSDVDKTAYNFIQECEGKQIKINKSDSSEVNAADSELEGKTSIDMPPTCSKILPKQLDASILTLIKPKQPESYSGKNSNNPPLISNKNNSVESCSVSLKLPSCEESKTIHTSVEVDGQITTPTSASEVAADSSKVQFQSFFFGRDEKSETYFRTTAKATFQVGSRVSLPSEDEPVNPMETAMIETIEEEDNPEEEETDPRNTCMLVADFSLHLSEDENIGNSKPQMVDKSIITTDSYLVRKARRASRNTDSSKGVKAGKAPERTIIASDVLKDDKKKLPALIPIVSEVSENPENISGKHSFGTQTCDNLDEYVVEEQKETGSIKSDLHSQDDPILKKSNELESCNKMTEKKEERTLVTIQISSSRSETELKGILKNKNLTSSVTLRKQDISNVGSVKNSDSAATRISSHSNLETQSAVVGSCQVACSENKSEGVELSGNKKPVQCRSSVSHEGTKDKELKNKLNDSSESTKSGREPELHGILKKSCFKKESHVMDGKKKDEARKHSDFLDDDSVPEEKHRRSKRLALLERESSEIKTRLSTHSLEPGLHGILKHNRRGSVSSETAADIHKRLEEDFPEVKRKSRGHSEEPEFRGILRKPEGLHKRSRKSLGTYECAKELEARFDRDNVAQDIKKSRKRASTSQIPCHNIHSPNENYSTDVRHSRKMPDIPQIHGILKNKCDKKQISRELTSVDKSEDILEDTSEVRRSRRHSVGSESSVTSKRIKIHSIASSDHEGKRRVRRLSEGPEIQGLLKSVGRSKKSSQISEVDNDLKLRLEEDFPVEVKSRRRRHSVDSDSSLGSRDKHEKRSRRYSYASDIAVEEGKHSSKSSLSSRRHNEDDEPISSLEQLKCLKPQPELELSDRKRKSKYIVDERHLTSRSERRSSVVSSSSDTSNVELQMEVDSTSLKSAKSTKCRQSSEKSLEGTRSPSLENTPESKIKNPSHENRKKSEKESSLSKKLDFSEEIVPIIPKKSRSLQEFPIRRSTRLHPILEDIKEEEEETPKKKRRSLDDLEAQNFKKERKANKKKDTRTFSPLVIANSDDDSEAGTPVKQIFNSEDYTKERRLTRTQKKVLLKNLSLIEGASPSTSSTPSSPVTPRRQGRKRTSVSESPPKTPSRTSLRLQNKPPSESD